MDKDEVEEATSKWDQFFDKELTLPNLKQMLTVLEERVKVLEIGGHGPVYSRHGAHTLHSRINNPQPPIVKEYRDLSETWCNCGHEQYNHIYQKRLVRQ